MAKYTKEELELIRPWLPGAFDKDGNLVGYPTDEKKPTVSEEKSEEKADSGYTKEELELIRPWLLGAFDKNGNLVGYPEKETPNVSPDTPKPETLDSIADSLREALGTNAYKETENSMKDLAASEKNAGTAAESEAARRSAELYSLLLSFGSKQNGRYDDLIAQIAEGDYRKNAGATAILEEYRAAADRSAAHAFADEAAENGGNPDSYAAAQAARGRLAVTKAGEEAARAYYGEQLDRLLSAISASGADMSRIYGTLQDNANERSDAADDALSLAAGLYEKLGTLQNDRRESDLKLYSSLLERGEETGVKNPDISPMEIDREYESLIGGDTNDDTAKITALITLWQKYPTMREYLCEKYEKVLKTSFLFK